MVTSANLLVERGFAPEKISSKSLSIIEVEKKTEPIKSKEARSFEAPALAAMDLSEEDFLPSDPETASEASHKGVSKLEPIKKSLSFEEIKLNSNIAEKEATEGASKSIKGDVIELNGSEPVKLYGFNKGPKIKASNLVANFRPISIESELALEQKALLAAANKTNNDHDKPAESQIDRISTGLAATEKSVENEIGKDIVFNNAPKKSLTDAIPESDEELVFFDYSESESLKDDSPKTNSSPKLGKVQAAKILAQSVSAPGPKKNALKTQSKDNVLGDILKNMGEAFKKQGSDKVAVAQATPSTKVNTQKENSFIDKNGFLEKNMNTQNHKSVYRLSVQSRSMGASKREKVQDYDLRFADDINDIRQSDANGQITLTETLNSPYAVRRGTVMSRGHYPTTLDFTFEGQEVNSTLPLITEASFNKVLETEGLTGLGGQILVQLDELTEDVELAADANYEKKLFLNRNLKVVDRADSDFYYILFIGVEPGNKIISFKTYKREVASKIIHVAQDEIYFDFNYYAAEKNDEFELFEDHLLSKESAVLSLSEENITDLQFDSLIEQLTLNRYQVKRALYPVGTRKYFELKHMKRPIYIGRWNSDYVDVPSQQYRDFALSSFGANQLDYQCMVQINLEKKAKDIFFEGKSFRGSMVPEMRILDTDGIFYKDLSDQSRRVFLLGEMQGALSVKIDYVDGSSDFLQTFCSAGGWVVEQL